MANRLAQAGPRVLTAVAGAGNQHAEYTLTANTEVAAPVASSPGATLSILLTENATGGWTITWSSDFATDTPVDIDTQVGYRSAFTFVGLNDGKWHTDAPFLTKAPL